MNREGRVLRFVRLCSLTFSLIQELSFMGLDFSKIEVVYGDGSKVQNPQNLCDGLSIKEREERFISILGGIAARIFMETTEKMDDSEREGRFEAKVIDISSSTNELSEVA